jgi:hypothetical protein
MLNYNISKDMCKHPLVFLRKVSNNMKRNWTKFKIARNSLVVSTTISLVETCQYGGLFLWTDGWASRHQYMTSKFIIETHPQRKKLEGSCKSKSCGI